MVGVIVEDRAVVVFESVAIKISVFRLYELASEMLIFVALLRAGFAVVHADLVTVVALLSKTPNLLRARKFDLLGRMLIRVLSLVKRTLGARLLNDLRLNLDELLDSASLNAVIDFDFINTLPAHLRLQNVWSAGGVEVFAESEGPAYIAVSSVLSFALAL